MVCLHGSWVELDAYGSVNDRQLADRQELMDFLFLYLSPPFLNFGHLPSCSSTSHLHYSLISECMNK